MIFDYTLISQLESYINIKYLMPIRINQKEEWSTSTKIKYQRTYKNITLQGVHVLDESIENFEEKIIVTQLMVGYDIL